MENLRWKLDDLRAWLRDDRPSGWRAALRKQARGLRPGQHTSLVASARRADGATYLVHLWVEVARATPRGYVGVLRDVPGGAPGLRSGMAIRFQDRHGRGPSRTPPAREVTLFRPGAPWAALGNATRR